MKTSLLKVMIFFSIFFATHSAYSKSIDDILKETENKYTPRAITTMFGQAIMSPNFLVYYKRSVVSDDFAKKIALLFEYSRETYISWGFKEPSFIPLKHVDVFINDLFERSFVA